MGAAYYHADVNCLSSLFVSPSPAPRLTHLRPTYFRHHRYERNLPLSVLRPAPGPPPTARVHALRSARALYLHLLLPLPRDGTAAQGARGLRNVRGVLGRLLCQYHPRWRASVAGGLGDHQVVRGRRGGHRARDRDLEGLEGSLGGITRVVHWCAKEAENVGRDVCCHLYLWTLARRLAELNHTDLHC